MLIKEKVIRLFARSILFENNETFDLMEAIYSPSAGGTGTGDNDLYKIPPSFDKAKITKNYVPEDSNIVSVDNVSSLSTDYTRESEIESCSNVGDFEKKVSTKIGEVGINTSNEDLDLAYKKIEKVIEDML